MQGESKVALRFWEVLSCRLLIFLVNSLFCVSGLMKTFSENGLDATLWLGPHFQLHTFRFLSVGAHGRPCLLPCICFVPFSNWNFKWLQSLSKLMSNSVSICVFLAIILHWSWGKALWTLQVKQLGTIP